MKTKLVISKKERLIAMIPLWNIEIPNCEDSIDFHGYEIIKNKSRADFREVYKAWDYLIRIELAFDPTIFKYEEDFKQWADIEYTRKIISFITVLRIYLAGDIISEDFSWILLDENHEEDHHHDPVPGSKKYIPDFLNTPSLDNIEDFERFYTMVGNLEDLADGVALTRFNSSYNKIDPSSIGEKLVDLIIVLESLFNKSIGDLKYKITLRTAHFLYPERHEDRHALFVFLSQCYNLRNAYVHGKKFKISEIEETERTCKGLQRIVERVLAKALDWRNIGKLNLFAEKIQDDEIDKVLINWQ